MVRYEGRLWMEGDAEDAATAGAVTLDDSAVSIQFGSAQLGRWPSSDVAIEPLQSGGYAMSVGSKRLVFSPADPGNFGEAARVHQVRRDFARPTSAALGTPPTPAPVPVAPSVVIGSPKNPGGAAVLSALFTGVGQIYNGQIGLGLLFMFLQVINVLLMFLLIGFLTFFATWLWSIFHAYNAAERYNRSRGFVT